MCTYKLHVYHVSNSNWFSQFGEFKGFIPGNDGKNTINGDGYDNATAKGHSKLILHSCACFLSLAQSPEKIQTQCVCLKLPKIAFFSRFIMGCKKPK